MSVFFSPGFPGKFGYAKRVGECVNVSVYSMLWWTSIPSMVYSCLAASIHGIVLDRFWIHSDPGQDKTVTENEWVNVATHNFRTPLIIETTAHFLFISLPTATTQYQRNLVTQLTSFMHHYWYYATVQCSVSVWQRCLSRMKTGHWSLSIIQSIWATL